MSYDAHITRAEFWAENENAWITSEEWSEVARSEPRLSERGPGLFVAEQIRSDGEDAALSWNEGDIWTADPDENTLGLMRSLALPLDARVQGDDGESY